MTSARAAAPELLRLRGTIQSVSDSVLVIQPKEGAAIRVNLPEKLTVSEVFPIEMSAMKPGDIVGSTGIPQSDGSLQAIEVRLFPGGEGPGDGQRPSNLKPGSVLVNGHLVEVATVASGWRLTLALSDKNTVVSVPKGAPIASYRPGDRSLFKVGTWVYLHANEINGQLQAVSATAGKNGFSPAQ